MSHLTSFGCVLCRYNRRRFFGEKWVYIEMNLFFDNDFDVYKIEKELDIKPAIEDLLKMLEGKLQIIKKICEENNGEVCFEIVSIFERDNLPAIYFEKRFLSIVNYLDAVIDIDMYLN